MHCYKGTKGRTSYIQQEIVDQLIFQGTFGHTDAIISDSLGGNIIY
jgi:hypothetical protein